MPIDQNLIELASAYSIDKLQHKTDTSCPYLCLLEDFLYPPLLEKLYNEITNNQNLPWQIIEYQKHRPRTSLSWLSDSVVEETHIVMESLTEEINRITGHNLKFNGISLWKDIESYTLEPHSDRDVIRAAIQIYLNEIDVDLSTKFCYNNKIISPVYRTNHGYFMDNEGAVQHWMATPVPKGFTRYSLYAIWKS